VDVNLREFYQQQLAPLSAADRLKLIALLANGLGEATTASEPPRRNMMELRGLGKEIWEGIDAQEYVNQLREEWDHKQ
jgi:hypothetical protein